MDFIKICNDWAKGPESQQCQDEFYTLFEKAVTGVELSPEELELFEQDTLKWHAGDIYWAIDAMLEVCGGEETAKALQAIILVRQELDLLQ